MIAKKKLYKKTLKKWGKEAQITLLIEELNELAVECCHLLRGRINFVSMTSEIADVEIMIDQIKHIYQMHEGVKLTKRDKLLRLERRLEEV